ncbi:MAG TPA: type II toxin-antitoxin system PrlF family antitoxin [Thermoanaerobaculia bacterium]|nr:type II toxin-antitoxin system PrlF family antitoxin [Thermoanaerobaculia bacterium]
MATAAITSKGQVTLPKAVRDHLHVDQGDRVEFVVEADGSVKVQRLARSVRELYGIARRPGMEPLSVEEMDAEIAQYLADDDERIRRQWHEDQD